MSCSQSTHTWCLGNAIISSEAFNLVLYVLITFSVFDWPPTLHPPVHKPRFKHLKENISFNGTQKKSGFYKNNINGETMFLGAVIYFYRYK